VGDKSYGVLKQFVMNYRQTAGKEVLDLASFRKAVEGIKLPPKQHGGVQHFFWLIEEFSLLDPGEKLSSLMKLVFKKSGLEEWLDDGTENGEQRIDNVKELLNVAVKWENLSWREALEQFLEEVALVTEIDNLEDTKDAVTMMTLHSAKGLEFDTVFFVGLEEGILPHSRSLLDPSELAEEVRLAYVGITRARKKLFLVYTKWRRLFGNLQNNIPSRILKALPAQSIHSNSSSFKLGDDEISYEPF
jgi:DNA helicase-2/ATP-dependent DNA helicase PcrA